MVLFLSLFYGFLFQLTSCNGFAPSVIPSIRHINIAVSTSSQGMLLNTALEWLASERRAANPYYDIMSWLDLSLTTKSQEDDTIELPLYPLPATYLPSETIHKIQNVQPSTIQLMLDVLASKDRRFCVALQATDTGRIAKLGTVLRLVNVDIQQDEYGAIRRVVSTCRPEKVVTIHSILSVHQPSNNNYRIAHVKPRAPILSMYQENQTQNVLIQLTDAYNAVRVMYANNSTTNAPVILPECNKCQTESEVYKMAEVWQSLCYTIRDFQERIALTNANEVMIAAARSKGGPLILPIRKKDLAANVVQQLEEMEVESQMEFIQMNLDPVLDFQVLLGLERMQDRLEWLTRMILREKCRLESLSPPTSSSLIIPKTETQIVERKGAWFDGAFD